MTKAKAMELMLEHSRAVIDPALARKIAQAFGYTLSELGIKPKRVRDFPRLNYGDETANLTAVSTFHLAQEIVRKKFGVLISSPCNGLGSYTEHTTEMCVEKLRS